MTIERDLELLDGVIRNEAQVGLAHRCGPPKAKAIMDSWFDALARIRRLLLAPAPQPLPLKPCPPHCREQEIVNVHIDADLSCTEQEKWKQCGIDKCVAPFVRALQEAGINMRGSCCGHGKAPMQIDLSDGRMVRIYEKTDWDKENIMEHESLKSQINWLADFIMAEVTGEPSQSEGAVDTAIRIIRKYLHEPPPAPAPQPCVTRNELRDWTRLMARVVDINEQLTTEQLLATAEANENYLRDKLEAKGVRVSGEEGEGKK